MKPFDLEKALAGEPVRCRDKEISVLRFIYVPENSHDDEKLISVLRLPDGVVVTRSHDESGRYMRGRDCDVDLFMATKKRTVYVNITKNSCGTALDSCGIAFYYDTENDALRKAQELFHKGVLHYGIAIPVEIEE